MGILEAICEERRADVSRLKRKRPPSTLVRAASGPRPAFPPRALPPASATMSFAGQAAARGRPFLIAECKRASPSKGLMVADYDPLSLAHAYEAGGASVVSVLTEPRRFLGADEHLAAVRAAIGLPVLRKDFVIDIWQLREAWALGADAVLLIAACLEVSQLAEFAAAARELGLSVLVETREASELEGAIAARPDAIGVNARDLRDFSISSSVPLEMLREIARLAPASLPRIAESGIKGGAEALFLRDAGYDGFLVGEALATAADPRRATADFVAAITGGDAAQAQGDAAGPNRGAEGSRRDQATGGGRDKAP